MPGWIALAILFLPTLTSAASSLQPVYDAALSGDMTRALAILDTVDTSGWTAKDSVAASCLKQTFRSPPRDEDLPSGSKAILSSYRGYWQDTMLQRKPIADAERQLLAELNRVLPSDSVASDLDMASERIKSVIRSEGLIGLTGVTSPFYELMLWKIQTASTYRMKLPEETVRVPVVFMDEFVSLGWAGYATCGRAHSGGWATQDSLYAVRSAYNVGTENFRVSYLSHEGQHFADYKRYPKLEQPELEYRAKLTEIAVSDSTLGFRHGPKTILNGATLVVVLLSNDPYARAYDLDLLRELEREGRAGALLALGAREDGVGGVESLIMPGMNAAPDLEIAPLLVLFAQAYALLASLALGLTPDRPDPAGTVNRVVQGVTIHPWNGAGGHVPRR
jgi:hypothetical protein